MRWNYIVIPLVAIVTSLVGGAFTAPSVNSWYKTIRLPAWTPPGSVIGIVWTILFILTAISALLVWNYHTSAQDEAVRIIMLVFVANAVFNVSWSYLFFARHLIGTAVLEAALLGVSVIILMMLIWPISRIASLLLAPYAAWVAFATYLTYSIWQLNR